MIYLNPEVRSGLGEKTFWVWINEEFPEQTKFVDPAWGVKPTEELPMARGDSLLQYSTMGVANINWLPRPGVHRIALCWELHHEMRDRLASREWDSTIKRIEQCASRCEQRTVASKIMRHCYKRFGAVDVLPIGVDCELFRPAANDTEKRELREKHRLGISDTSSRVCFWAGTSHPMKGFDLLQKHAAENPTDIYVIVWKSRRERSRDITLSLGLRSIQFTGPLPQETISELMRASDCFLCTSRLRPYYMVEWEAMACNLPVVIVGEQKKDFVPSENPRDDVLREGWSRVQAKEMWRQYLGI